MTAKTFEVRDRMTFISVLAVRLDPSCEQDRYLLARAGYGITSEGQARFVFVTRLIDGEMHRESYEWNQSTRTMPTAHEHIRTNFDDLVSGQVVDVEFVLGETAVPKESERDGG